MGVRVRVTVGRVRAAVATVAVLALPALVLPAAADASKLPTPKQAKALERAFASDHRHPRNAVIINMRVSTVDRSWFLVKWVVAPRHPAGDRSAGTAAKQKVIDLHPSYYHGSRVPKPASKPPRPVKKDLHKGLWLKITFIATGHEDAHAQRSASISCGGPDGTETRTQDLHATFTWTGTDELALDQPLQLRWVSNNGKEVLADAVLDARPADPTIGSGSVSWTNDYKDTSGCNPAEHSTWKWNYEASKIWLAGALFVSTGAKYPRGTYVRSPLHCASATPSPSADCANDPSRLSEVNNGLAFVPLTVGLGGITSTDTGPWDVAFPESVPEPDVRNVTSTSTGMCKSLTPDFHCTDTLDWTGHVSVEQFDGGS